MKLRVPWTCPNPRCRWSAKMPAGKRVQCKCGHTSTVPGPPSLARRVEYPPRPLPVCQYRGPQVRQVKCMVCGEQKGKMVPVFACDLHGECTERKTEVRRSAIQSCIACTDQSFPPGLKVAILSPFFAFGGGVEQWIHSLLVYSPAEIDYIGIGLLTDDRGVYEWDRAGVEYVLPYTSVSIGARACRRLAEEADVLIAWGVTSLNLWFDERPNKPIVFVNHGQSEWSQRLLDGAKTWADKFVAVGEAALALHPESELIPNGVDLLRCQIDRKFKPAAREALGLPQDALVIGQIGRLVSDKDAAAVARAVATLGDQAWGLLVGQGHPKHLEDLKTLAGGRLVHVPATPQIAVPLAAMDCFLFSSLSEGFGLAVVEAWAAGVPVVSTRVGIVEKHPELVVEVPLKADGPTLAAAVRQAIHPSHRPQVQAAQKLVTEQYSARRMAEAWAQYLRSVASERSQATA